MFENLAHWARDGGHIRLAQARCRSDQCIEHRLQIESRAADDLEHVGGRGLLRQRFVQLARTRFEFLLQLRSGFANAVNVSSRLRFVRTKTGNASSALHPFASQDHLVGTVTGPPFRSAQPRIEPINPNRTARRTRTSSLDHLVGAGEQGRGNVEAKRLCGLEVDDKLVLGRLLDAKVSGFRPLENFVDKSAAGGTGPISAMFRMGGRACAVFAYRAGDGCLAKY